MLTTDESDSIVTELGSIEGPATAVSTGKLFGVGAAAVTVVSLPVCLVQGVECGLGAV